MTRERLPTAAARNDDGAERIERVQRAVGGPADVRLASRHLELAAGLRGRPDFTTLIELDRPGDPLEGVRIVAEQERASVLLQRDRARVARPCPRTPEDVDA